MAETDKKDRELDQEPEGEKEERQEHGADADACPELQAEIERLQTVAQERLDDLQRVQAEYANYRKRAIRDQKAAGDMAVRKVVERFLPIIDHIDMALASTDGDDQLTQGVKMIHTQVANWLSELEVKAIDPVGEEFDPHIAEPIMTVAHESDQGTVVSVQRKGYSIKDYVLRPAMVVVSQGCEEDGQGGSDNG